jgi:hypothetical protein
MLQQNIERKSKFLDVLLQALERKQTKDKTSTGLKI